MVVLKDMIMAEPLGELKVGLMVERMVDMKVAVLVVV
jgi:hypothetical protein